MARSRLHELSARGVSVWFDTLSRDLLETGELARMIEEDAVVGVTSNPTIFQKALAEGDRYDGQIRELQDVSDTREVFFALAMDDIRAACDLLRPVWDATAGVDGFVSLEVDPTLAYDREATYEQAMRFHEEVERPNLYVKIPATQIGLTAIEDSIAQGKSINVTLIFSLQRYAAVVEAYLRGLERLVAAGGDPAQVNSVASFFVSRVDTEADKRLEAAGPHGSAGPSRGRQREARVRALGTGVRRRALDVPRVEGRTVPALPLGLDLDEEPGLSRRRVRRGADRPRDGEHDAAGDDPRLPGPRRGARRHALRRARRSASRARRAG